MAEDIMAAPATVQDLVRGATLVMAATMATEADMDREPAPIMAGMAMDRAMDLAVVTTVVDTVMAVDMDRVADTAAGMEIPIAEVI